MAPHPVNGHPPIRLLFTIGGAKVDESPPSPRHCRRRASGLAAWLREGMNRMATWNAING